jgi:hypothetical protein
MMPHLPAYVPAEFAGGLAGTVRVIWPAPTDASSVANIGTFVVTGRVPGTSFQPKATVAVKAAAAIAPPERALETFALDRVTLDKDAEGRDTPFIKNRDKFLRGLAASNPDNFLYNFRETFGQPQPAGTKALGGWDSQTTKLRGHASGHYLSAIAQAYASTAYDPALRQTFLQKINYLVDTLYDLSQKSGHPAEAGGPSVADPLAVPVGAGHETYDSNLRADAIRTTTGIGAWDSSARIRPISSSCSSAAPRMARRTARFGRRITRCTRFSRVCSIRMKSPATRRRSTSRAAWALGERATQRAARRHAHQDVEPVHRRLSTAA